MNDWPNPDRESLEDYFGKHELGGDGKPTAGWEEEYLTLLEVPYPLRLSWETDKVVNHIRCHKRVANSLYEILETILAYYGDLDGIKRVGMDLYGGCYNYRATRGGQSLSMHSWGIAIDLDPDHNPLGKIWEPNCDMMPEEVSHFFNMEGWLWGGKWSRPDAQHFQTTRPY